MSPLVEPDDQDIHSVLHQDGSDLLTPLEEIDLPEQAATTQAAAQAAVQEVLADLLSPAETLVERLIEEHNRAEGYRIHPDEVPYFLNSKEAATCIQDFLKENPDLTPRVLFESIQEVYPNITKELYGKLVRYMVHKIPLWIIIVDSIDAGIREDLIIEEFPRKAYPTSRHPLESSFSRGDFGVLMSELEKRNRQKLMQALIKAMELDDREIDPQKYLTIEGPRSELRKTDSSNPLKVYPPHVLAPHAVEMMQALRYPTPKTFLELFHDQKLSIPDINTLFEWIRSSDTIIYKNRALLFGGLISQILKSNNDEAFDQFTPPDEESALRLSSIFKDFMEQHDSEQWGESLIVMIACAEFEESASLERTLADMSQRISSMEVVTQHMAQKTKDYDDILRRHIPRHLPSELETSLGIEYEYNEISCQDYTAQTRGCYIEDDLHELSKIAPAFQFTLDTTGEVEFQTAPSTDPYKIVLQTHLLHEIGLVDFNFRSKGNFEKGAHGFHLTLGGTQPITIDEHVFFWDHTMTLSGWGGLNAGSKIDASNLFGLDFLGERHLIMEKTVGSKKHKAAFPGQTKLVEFKGFLVDTQEQFERALTTTYYAGIAIQAAQKYVEWDVELMDNLKTNTPKNAEELIERLNALGKLKQAPPPTVQEILYTWLTLQVNQIRSIEDHNQNFLDREQHGYLDEQGAWIDVSDFGGESNSTRFESVVAQIEPGSTVQGYTSSHLTFDPASPFNPPQIDTSNTIRNLVNLFLKPSEELGGDRANARSFYQVTKTEKGEIEETSSAPESRSLFKTNGKEREGYYTIQGGSEHFLIHAAQRNLLRFRHEMREILGRV